MNNCSKELSGRPRPFIKWAGGKSRIASDISSFFPIKYNKYYEPFLGSAAVYFEISPQYGRLNDLNKNLIKTYQIIKSQPRMIIEQLMKIENEYNQLTSIDAKSEYYYEIRERYNNAVNTDLEQSAFFIFLNKAGWNGMYRENSNCQFNIPFGKRERITLFDEKNIMNVSANIQKMEFTSLDYKDAVLDAGPGDLIYFDPPYFPISKTASFTDYQKDGFSELNQKELWDLALDLANRGCFVAISNSDCRKANELYSDFRIEKIKISRTIGAKATSRKRINEIIALSY